ncbi:MAG: ferritin family protein [Desulfopila sp.]|jgi:rubrerythrin|nr:ferritin family protein [Desulfopila sp.]
MNFGSVDEILQFAIDKEKEAVTFYTDLSKKESISSLKQTFRELAQEEAKHVKMLTGLSKNKTAIDSYEVKEITDLKISDYLTEMEYVEGMPMEDIITLAMKREEMAVRLYSDLAGKTSEKEAVKLFKLLAQEESEHKLTFEKMYDDYLEGQGN